MTFENPLLFHALVGVILIVSSFVVGKVLAIALRRWVKKLVSRTKTDLDDRIVEIVARHIPTVTLIAGVALAVQEIQKAVLPHHLTAIQVLAYLEIALFIVIVFVAARILIQLTEVALGWYMDQVAKKTSTNVAATIAPLANRIIQIVLSLVAIIIVLDHFGINIGSLLVSLGVASLAIALAAQDTLANMIAGFVIMVDRPFRVGDRVLTPSGEIGDIYEIGLRSTRILNLDNNLIIIPNAELIKNRITNFSYPQDVIRVVVDVGVAYGTDIDKAKYTMLDLAKSDPDILPDPLPEVFLVDFGDSAIQLRLIARTADYRKKFKIETALREKIYAAFKQHGIEIPFPQRVVHLAGQSNESEAHHTKQALQRKGVRPRRR